MLRGCGPLLWCGAPASEFVPAVTLTHARIWAVVVSVLVVR